MPIYKVYKDELCWGIWKVDEALEELVHLVPNGNQLLEEANRRFVNLGRKMEWVAVRVLLYHLLGEQHEIAYHSSGKPYLKDYSYCISISHTKGYVAVAYHPTTEVGIDIEQYATRVLKVRNRFMRADEHADGIEVYALLLHWSAKETLFKLLEQEEVDFKAHLQISPFVVSTEGEMNACEHKTPKHQHYKIRYLVESDFVLTWSKA